MVETAELIVLKSINNKLQELIDIFQIKAVVNAKLADLSQKEPRISSGKPMPEMRGDYVVAKYPCKKCGGAITWDNYSKEIGGQNYPDHLDDDGKILPNGCPEWNK